MNWQHFQAFVWLRWRLRVNQFRRGGTLNAVFLVLILVVALLCGVGLFITGFAVGLLALKDTSPLVRLLAWDGLVVGFLFLWMIGLLTELQRAEALALDRFLHLPVSVSGAFLINYLSSLFSLTLIVCVPGMVGLVLGQVFAVGPVMLLALPLLAAFVLAVTGVTYQFQGWLASLMANPRRRRTVIVLVTGGFILLFQVPNLINVFRPWNTLDEPGNRMFERQAELRLQLATKQIDPKEYDARTKQVDAEYQAERAESRRQTEERVSQVARLVSLVLPPGWLAVGAADLADGHVVPALLGTLGLALIGTASLGRAYRTTLRLYTGHFTAGDRRPDAPAPAAVAPPDDPTRLRLVERRLPWVSEQASAVATAGLRSLMRAPEAKMALLAPIIMGVVMAGVSSSSGETPIAAVRPLLALGVGVGVMLLIGLQLIGNQFGYDRTGFRAFVLSPVPRRDILVGKNLAVAPLAVGLGLLLGLLAGLVFPMRVDHYPALLAQIVSAYLILCLLANAISIAAPIPLAAGSMQPAQVKAGPVLLQMAYMMVLPFAMLPVFVPIGLEALLEQTDVIPRGVPVSLGLSLLVLAGVVYVYRGIVTAQGDWLAGREKKILEVVTSKAE